VEAFVDTDKGLQQMKIDWVQLRKNMEAKKLADQDPFLTNGSIIITDDDDLPF
jgi:hypothetical protein